MKKIIEFFIDKSLVVNLFTVLIFLTGGISAWFIQKDMFPAVDFDVIIVTTAYPGSSSEDVEKLVTLSVERSLKEVDGIKEMNAMSAEGVSIVYLTIEPDADLKEVEDDIKTAVDSVDDFPEEVKEPRILSINNKNRRGVVKIALFGAGYDHLRKESKKLRDVLEQDKNISLVEIQGYREDEIVALLDPEKIKKYDVTISEVSNAVARSNVNLSAGKIEAPYGDVFVRTLNEFEGPEDVENVVVRSNSEGQKILVKDVANVVQRPLKDGIIGRSDGVEALFLDVRIKGSADIVRSAKTIKKKATEFLESSKLKYQFFDDQSYFVKRRLNVLTNNGMLGMILVFGCLLFFLNFSTSVITSLGAPIAFMISFIAMYFMGLSMNLISMFGLILVLGMLVDDSIIVAEQYYQKLEDGMEPREAARKAAMETIKPVTATIVTTMIAFGALFFMGGIMGKFLWPVPAVVIVCLAASWFECFFILPSHLADFVRLKKEKGTHSSWYLRLLKIYGGSLRQFMRFPTMTVFMFGGLFVGSIILAKNMNFELFPGDDVRTVFLQFKGQVGTSKDVTSKEMLAVEKEIVKIIPKNEITQIQARVGMLIGEHGNKTGSHYGSIVLYLTDPGDRERTTDQIVGQVTKIAKEIVSPEYEIIARKNQGGPPRGKDVQIDIKSDSIADLKKASQELKEILASTKGVVTTEIDFEEGNDQIVFKVNEEEARRLGLDIRMIAMELRKSLAGDPLTEIKKSDEDVEVKVKFDERIIKDESPLVGLSIINSNGRRIPLDKVVRIEKKPGAFVIRRQDRKRIFSVSGAINRKITNPKKITKDLRPAVEEVVSKHEDMTFAFTGENKDTNESMVGLLRSFLLAFACIFMVLVLMFNSLTQPVTVMSAIPLGLIGVIWSFFFFGKTLGFMAMMGVVGLVGVVINDSIVLVNFINIMREKEKILYKAVFKASLSRMRPVILTTFTTVAGLMPVAHAIGGDPFIKPMAMSFAWGLLFATAVTLIYIPCLYIVFEKIKNLFRGKNRIDLGTFVDIDEIETKVEHELAHVSPN